MKIVLDTYEDIINLLAELFFNNNAKRTLTNILEASVNNNNNFTLNTKNISVPNLISHSSSCIKVDFQKYLGYNSTIKQDFKSNFYLLTSEIQNNLLLLLKKAKDDYHYFYGTSLNLSAYTSPINSRGNLDFYINISSSVGKSSIYDFIGRLNSYNAALKSENNENLPNTTVIISRYEHLKNNKTEISTNFLYDKMLQILGHAPGIDCFEADADDLKLIINNI